MLSGNHVFSIVVRIGLIIHTVLQLPGSAQVSDVAREASFYELDDGIVAATQKIDRDPEAVREYLRRAFYYDQKLELVAAIKDFGNAIRISPSSVQFYLFRGELWREIGEPQLADADFDEGLRLIEEMLRTDPELHRDKLHFRAWAWYAKRNTANAIRDLDLAIEIAPESHRSMLLVTRGMVLQRQGDSVKAEADFTRSIELDPQQAAARSERGRLRLARGDVFDAISDFNEAIRFDPIQPSVYTSRAIAYMKLGEFEKAIVDCSAAIKVYPLYAPAYRHRGCAYLALQRVDLALIDLNKAIGLTPNYTNPGWSGSEISIYRGPRNRVYYYDFLPQLDRASVWRMKGEWEKAIDDLKETLRMDPASSQAQNDLAWVQATCPDAKYRDGKSAIDLARKACEATKWKKDDYIVTLAAAHAEVGEYDEAVKRMTEASEIDPKRDAATREQLLKLFKQSMPHRDSVKDK